MHVLVWLFCRHKGRLPEIRLVVLCLRDRLGRQRTDNTRDHPPLRGGLGQVLWKCALCPFRPYRFDDLTARP